VLEARRRRRSRLSALTAIGVLLASLTGCSTGNLEPSPTTTTAPTASPLITPSPIVTTIGGPGPGPGPEATAIGPTATTLAPNGEAQWTFIVVRHANWRDDGTDDGPLTEAGKLRALRLADLLYAYAGVATYATKFRRATGTARPTAELWKVPVTIYDGATPAPALVNQIKQQHPQGAILIVGHSDNLSLIVSELCRCRINAIPESDYAPRYEIALRSDSSVISVQEDAGY
jgi:phosphohistidine phosphatase SixA